MGGDRQDHQLISQAVSGDRVALQTLLLAHYAHLHSHISARLPKTLQAMVGPDDVLQDAFADAFRDIRNCRAETAGAFCEWLKTIAEHRLHDTVRTLKRRKRGGGFHRAGAHADGQSSVADLVEVLSQHGFTPSKVVAKDEAKQAVEVALTALPDDYRQAVQLYYLEGKGVSEVAEKMGRTPGAVRGMLDRARKKLHELLGNASKYLTVK